MKKIKVLEVVSGINYGGVEILLLNYFKKIDMNLFEITIITHDVPNTDNEKEFTDLGIRIFRVTPKRKNVLKNAYEIAKLIKEISPDVIHCHMTLSNYMSLLLAKLYKVKVRISHSHEANSRGKLDKIYQFIINKTATKRLACSNPAAEYSYGSSKGVVIFPNAIDINRFIFNDDIRKKIRITYNIPEDYTVIGNIGRCVEVKNQFRLIDIYAIYLRQHEKSLLMVIGDGPLKEQLEHYAERIGINDHVIFVGNVNDIYDYYNALDYFVQTSISEGFGLTVIEAQSNGLPCVVSNGIPDNVIFNNNVCVLSLDNTDEEWVDVIESLNKKRTNELLITDSNYNLDNSYIELEKLYVEGCE